MESLNIAGTSIILSLGDITSVTADAIVNAANNSLLGGGGVDGAIHMKGGPAILEACKAIRRERYPDGLPTGQAVITPGGNLPSRFVIHTVGPVWHGGTAGEAELLARAYRNSLAVAGENGIRSIAFPSISTGAYGYPIEKAADVALRTVQTYIKEHPGTFTEVRFVLFSPSDLSTYSKALQQIRASDLP